MLEFIKRHGLYITIATVVLFVLSVTIAELRTLLISISAGCVAIFIASVWSYSYTKLNFTKIDDGKPETSQAELIGKSIVLGCIAIASALVVLGVFAGLFVAGA